MKSVLLDTNAYAAFKRGNQEAVQIVRYAETIGVSTIVLGELLSGFAAGNREAENRQELTEFLESPRVVVLSVDDETSEFYAHTYQVLKRKGKPIPSNDLWIASTALQHGFAVFTYDGHFSEIVCCPQITDSPDSPSSKFLDFREICSTTRITNSNGGQFPCHSV